MSRSRGGNRCRLNAIDTREIFVEIRFPFARYRALIGTLAVTAIELLDNVHAGSHLAKWSEALAVEAGIVPQIDEELGGTGIWTGSGKSESAGTITLGNGIVFDVGALPGSIYGRVGSQSKLNDEARDDAEESGVIVEAVLDQVVEAIGADRSPCPRHLHDNVALGGGELHFVNVGCLGCKSRWM